MVFLEDHMIDDGTQGESPSSSTRVPFNLDPIFPLMENVNQGEDVQEDGDKTSKELAHPIGDVKPIDGTTLVYLTNGAKLVKGAILAYPINDIELVKKIEQNYPIDHVKLGK